MALLKHVFSVILSASEESRCEILHSFFVQDDIKGTFIIHFATAHLESKYLPIVVGFKYLCGMIEFVVYYS
jgi:hypothetical protein